LISLITACFGSEWQRFPEISALPTFSQCHTSSEKEYCQSYLATSDLIVPQWNSTIMINAATALQESCVGTKIRLKTMVDKHNYFIFVLFTGGLQAIS